MSAADISSSLHFFDARNDTVQVVSAREANAYPGTVMLRTMAMVRQENFEKPFVIDIVKVNSERKNRYDLPIYFMGQVLDSNFDYETAESLIALGSDHGYQHLFVEGVGKSAPDGNSRLQWMGERKFYTWTSATHPADQLLFVRIGANDPDFNLRRDAALMIRREDTADTVFVSVIEPHGSYSPVSEFALDSRSGIAEVKLEYDDQNYTAISVRDVKGTTSLFVVSNRDNSASRRHRVEIRDRSYRWRGPYHYATID